MNGLLRVYFPKGTDLSPTHPATCSRSRTTSTTGPGESSGDRNPLCRALRRTASLREAARVATLTRTCPAAALNRQDAAT